MAASRAEDVIFHLNDSDEIVFVNDAWDAFAAANGGEKIVSGRILGRSLWPLIADAETRKFIHDILGQVRAGRTVRFAYRCDAPDCRRQMDMQVMPDEAGLVVFRSRTTSESPRAPEPLLDPNTARTTEVVRVCGWCKRVRVNEDWLEIEEAASRAPQLRSVPTPSVSHGICDDCRQRLMQETG